MDLRHAPRTLLSLGAVNIAGTPVGDQVALWNDLDTIQGSANFTFDGSTLDLTGTQTTSGLFTAEGGIKIDTASDLLMLEIIGHSSQSNPLIHAQTSGGGNLFQLTESLVFQSVPTDLQANAVDALKVGQVGATTDIFTVDTVNKAVRIGLGPEVLVDGDFTSFANWTDAGDFNEGSGAYDYLLAINNGSLTQANATLATLPKNNTVYDFTYTLTNILLTPQSITLATPFASVATDLIVTAGTHTIRFTSGGAASSADFVIASNGGATGDGFTIDNISLKEVVDVDLEVPGLLKVGTGIAWGPDLNGNIGTDQLTSRPDSIYVGTKLTVGVDAVVNRVYPTFGNALNVHGSAALVDSQSTGPNINDQGNDPSGSSWEVAGDLADGSSVVTYTHAGGTGTLTQANAFLQNEKDDMPNRYIKLLYTFRNVTINGAITVTLSNAIADVAQSLVVAEGNHSLIFRAASGASTADLVLDMTSTTAGDSFDLDNVFITEVRGGDLEVAGHIGGGGPNGLSINGSGSLRVDFAGPHAWGTVTLDRNFQHTFGGNYTTSGGGSLGAKMLLLSNLTGDAGKTSLFAASFQPNSIATQTETADIINIATVNIREPIITDNLTGNIINAAALMLPNAPTEALYNYSLLSESGNVQFGSLGSDNLDEAPPETLSVIGGNIETYDVGTVAGESLTDPLTPDDVDWDAAGDFSIGEGDAIYTHSTGSGTFTQQNAFLAIAGKNNRWYSFTYQLTNFAGAATTATITSAFAASAVTLDFSANGTYSVVFQSNAAADAADFVISVTSAGGDSFRLIGFALTEVIGGDMIAAGAITGGGADGLRIDGDGNTLVSSDTAWIGWGDTQLHRDGPWELALRDGLNDNFFYIYGTFTDPSNYERLAIYAGSNVDYFVEPQSAGTGTANINMHIRPLGGAELTLGKPDALTSVKMNGSLAITHDFARTNIFTNTATVSTPSGQTATATGLIPAGALLIAISARVLTEVTGPAGFDIGDGVDVDRFGNSRPVALGTTTDLRHATTSAITTFPVANDVVLTSDGVAFTGGSVKLVAHYISVLAPSE
jgi:hypothetical protein